MKRSEWVTIGLAVATFLGTLILASMWLGSLSTRVDRLENEMGELRMGPRGNACQMIIKRLVDQPKNGDLQKLADKYQCAGFPAATAPTGESSVDWPPANK